MEAAKPQKKRPWIVLLFPLAAGIGLIYVLLTISPTSVYPIFFFKISPSFFFFPLVFFLFYGLCAFFLKSALQGMLIALLIDVFLFFRFVNLTHPLFLILLLILFASLEAVIWKKDI